MKVCKAFVYSKYYTEKEYESFFLKISDKNINIQVGSSEEMMGLRDKSEVL